jgi:flagellar hook protein FlgE
MGFEQALSGLNAASQNLDNIGNNIANASTIGFKDARAEFSDVYASSLWGATATQIGIGTQVAAIAPEFTQGNITTTGNPLDVAINGGGFFRETKNGVVSYSRDGEFSLDANGNIVNSSGAQLTGYPVTANGTISSAPPVPLTLSQAPVAPSATTTASLSLNLDSSATAIPAATTFSAANASSFNSSTSMTVYDSQGNSHTVSMYFVKSPAATNTWNIYATGDGTQLNGIPTVADPTGAGLPVGTLAFNSSGTLASGTDYVMPSFTMPGSVGASAMTITTTFPAASTSQYGVPFSVSANNQNGYATGQLAGFTIGNDGVISGRYTNGQTRAQGQIALANFINPQGLIAEGGNQFSESSSSGAPVVGAPGSGSLGSVQSGALESSTVDLTTELVNMITAQRVYQANAETVKTEDQVQQTLMNLR